MGELIRRRRHELKLSLNDLAVRLNLRGYSTTKATIHHWEKGVHNPPVQNYEFRFHLAEALELDVNDMMMQAGYFIADEKRTPQARMAADIIDSLPEEKRDTALRLLEALRQ